MPEINPKQIARDLQEIAWASQENRDEFVKLVVHNHLTHQQRVSRLLHQIIKAINEYPYTDLRNEAAKKWAAKTIQAVGDDPYFPLI